jgi:serine/threonine-protein kinase
MAGTRIGHYEIIRLLGQGGMGQVYLAEDVDLRRRVALKVLHATLAAEPSMVARMLNEARAASAVRHPAFVTVFDWGHTDNGAPYFTMELLDGQSLEQRLAAGPLPLPDCLRIGEQVAEGLAAAHALSIVHRDLKPSNIFLVAGPETTSAPQVKLLDFGIVKLGAELMAQGSETKTGQLLGTPLYMSPEQCLGRKDVDHRADLYAFGAVLFEMICGRPPFVVTAFGELINLQINGTPPRVAALRPDVPAALDSIVARALAKRPEDRPRDAAEMGRALKDSAARVKRADADTSSGASAFTTAATQGTAPSTPVVGKETVPSAATFGPRSASNITVPPVEVNAPPTPRAEAGSPARPRPLWISAVVAAATVLLVVGGFRLMRSNGRPSPVAPPVAPLVQPGPPQLPPLPPPSPPKEISRVAIQLETTPSGASVRSVPADDDLGPTPLRLEGARDSTLTVKIRMPGYRPAVRTLIFDNQSAPDHVVLQRLHASKRDEAGDDGPIPEKL